MTQQWSRIASYWETSFKAMDLTWIRIVKWKFNFLLCLQSILLISDSPSTTSPLPFYFELGKICTKPVRMLIFKSDTIKCLDIFYAKQKKKKKKHITTQRLSSKIPLNQKIYRKIADFLVLDNLRKQRHLVPFWVSFNILPFLPLQWGKM